MAIEAEALELARAVGPRLRRYRRAADVTQADLAEQLGVKQAAVSSWETGIAIPPLTRVVAVCIVLGLGLALVLGSLDGQR